MLVWARQIKAAHSLIGWEQFQLATKAGVGIATIRRLERMSGPINAHFETVEKIRRALEQAGIEFVGERGVIRCVSTFPGSRHNGRFSWGVFGWCRQ